MTSAAVERPRTHLVGLTVLRGCAALWVVCHNDVFFRELLQVDSLTGLVAKGYLAVDYFLLLSGFVLAYVHSQDFRRWSWSKYQEFLLLRLARIYPLYLVLLGFRFAVELLRWQQGDDTAFTTSHSASALLANILMLQAWGAYDYMTWIPAYWSVSAEWFAYLLFPMLLIALPSRDVNRLGRNGWLLALVCLGVLGWGVSTLGKLEFPIELSLLRCVPEFILGVLLGLRCDMWEGFATRSRIVLTLVLLASGMLVSHFGGSDLLFLLLASGLLITLGNPEHQLDESKLPRVVTALVFLGQISYAIYLCHLLVHGAWHAIHPRLFGETPSLAALWLSFAMQLTVILLVAAALHIAIEKPTRHWLRGKIQLLPTAPLEERTK